MRLDHLAIAVESIEGALPFWRDQLGLVPVFIESEPVQGARVAFLGAGETKTELLEPSGSDSPIAKFLAMGRKGVHHIAYAVDDLDAELARLKRLGVRLVHEKPIAGSRGTRTAFIHPHASSGALVELIEYPKGGGDPHAAMPEAERTR